MFRTVPGTEGETIVKSAVATGHEAPKVMPFVVQELSACTVGDTHRKRQVNWQHLFMFAKCFGITGSLLRKGSWKVSEKLKSTGEFPGENLCAPEGEVKQPSTLGALALLSIDVVSTYSLSSRDQTDQALEFLRNMTCHDLGVDKEGLVTVFHMIGAALFGTLDDPVSSFCFFFLPVHLQLPF